MFKKPFKLKSQNQLKNSEKKKFASELRVLFPSLSENDISGFVNNKENVTKVKLMTFKGEDVDVYCIDKVPMYIDVMGSGIKLPTVFMMWQFPHLLPMLTSNSAVFEKLKSGADLFFPGIYLEGLLYCGKTLKKADPVALNLIDNKVAVAIGVSLIDKEILLDEVKNKEVGKIVKIYHTAGDYLFKMLNDSIVIQLGPPDWTYLINQNSQLGNDLDEENSNLEKTEITVQQIIKPDDEVVTHTEEKEEESPNELLEYCFFKSIKTIPKDSYPILPATFYAKYILTNLPEGKNLNLKKTKWKKFSTFLQEKSLEGIINLQQVSKNDFKIAGANLNHPQVKSFVDPYNVVSVVMKPRSDNKPVVQQIYFVSAITLPFFSKFGYKKHDELTRNDVRNYLNDYIKSENLVDPNKPEFVILDPILYQILKGDEVISRGNLLQNFLLKMGVQHKVSSCVNGETIIHKGKMPLIEFEICLKTGNKKVTVISNLECYGINASVFAKELQHKAAASTTIIPSAPGKKGPQIQVQGNQIAVAFVILKEKYNMTERCIKGLEKAVKSKR